MSDEIIDQLLLDENKDVLDEITDATFANRKHYNKSLYAAGCRGPLCRKRERDLGRASREALAAAEGRVYRPGSNRLDERDEFLGSVVEWHHAQIDEIRERARREKRVRSLEDRIAEHTIAAEKLRERLEGLSA